jgi:hypothetical protein
MLLGNPLLVEQSKNTAFNVVLTAAQETPAAVLKTATSVGEAQKPTDNLPTQRVGQLD